MMLDVADDGTLRNRSERQNITDNEIGLLTTVDELAGINTLGGNEELLLVLESEGVAEGDASERSAAAGVVDDLGDDALEVAVALAEVEGAEAGRAFTVVGVGLEHGPGSLTLCPDHTTHCGECSVCVCVGRTAGGRVWK